MNKFEISMRQSEQSQHLKQGIIQDDNIASDEENEDNLDDEYNVEDTEPDCEEEEEGDTDSDVQPESDDEEDSYQIDEQTLVSIIKVQAHVRGFLTRKMIYEHLE